jgi:hypothetical protein
MCPDEVQIPNAPTGQVEEGEKVRDVCLERAAEMDG